MRLMQYDGRWFRIGADAVHDEEGRFVGYWPGFSTVLEVPPDKGNTPADTSIYGWIPGGPIPDYDEALRIAAATVRLNWDATKGKRAFRPGDRVGHRGTFRKGIIVAPPRDAGISGHHTFVEFDPGRVDEVALSELIFLP